MTDPARTVLVFGATGAQGGPVARALAKAGYSVRAATRHPERAPEGTEPVACDLAEPTTILQAADGAELAFLHLPMSLGGPQGAQAAVDALQKAGVRHLVFNTGMALPEEPVGVPRLDDGIRFAAEVLADGATVLVPTGYMENFSAPWSAPRVAAGELLYPLPADAANAWVTNDDVGACTVAAFQRGEAVQGRRFRVAGPEVLTLPDVADRLGQALGRDVAFRQVSGAEYGELLAPVLGPEMGAMIGAGYDRMPPGPNPLLTPDTAETREALGVTFTPLVEWARRQDWSA